VKTIKQEVKEGKSCRARQDFFYALTVHYAANTVPVFYFRPFKNVKIAKKG
jgi:hypothetical protein